MKIYNTLSRTKEDFVPITPGQVKMYVCGPTVYDFIHIGNARPAVVFDTVRRYMEYKGLTVEFVSNYTDIDDRIIQKALAEQTDASVISERFISECEIDMKALNILPATVYPKATEEVEGMLQMISTLIERGHAYQVADGTVYFRVRSFESYGKLSRKNLDDLRSGDRSLQVSGENQKEDPLDFVLWKPKKEGEPFWTSPWCDGRPGWHIECSVMGKKYLGDEIDIHAGGEDLIFPHHENEIAQSEAANEKPFAHTWMHNAFLNIDNKKMAKSENNFFTVREICEKYEPQVLRFFLLSSHYRSPMNFTADSMAAAKAGLMRITGCVENLDYRLEMKETKAQMEKLMPSGVVNEAEAELLTRSVVFSDKFEAAMDDDFNTADALAAIFELVKFVNSHTDDDSSPALLFALREQIIMLTGICGLIVGVSTEALTVDIERLIEERQKARKERDFARADEIRAELAAIGITLEDTREGVKWRKE
ncbi:MAG: cysteine--tRNA ligase [Lachnospiraceae bacterium]|nr:cysteine--tRNA ligase [Lachnospiraceae bacterium]